jgi:hypothetical protein
VTVMSNPVTVKHLPYLWIPILRGLLLSALLAGGADLAGQVRGRVIDSEDRPLPFATVHVKGTTQGVSANTEGQYQLDLPPGSYELVFQYIGYASRTLPVTLGASPLSLDVALSEAGIDLAAIEVLAGREDPAYPIIREAIRRRPAHRDRIRSYQCRAYIKGEFRLLDMPDTLFGGSVRNMIGADSSGYLYLSESESEIAFERPDKRREVMVASRVSGNSNGFSFNRFGILDFYENTQEVGRPLVNPIADNALAHYRYRLLLTYLDEEGREVHKIAVLPRRPEDPVYAGTLYILGDTYRLHSLDLRALKGNTKIDLLDTFVVQQAYLPVDGDYWPLFQQTLRFRAGLLGFSFGGGFTAVTSDYVINPVFPSGFFTREIMSVREEANRKDSLFWEERRPIPLTGEEARDYARRDSLADIMASRPYLDSLDRQSNRLRPIQLITGYTYQQRWRARSWRLGPATDWYNAVQGWSLGLKGSLRQDWRNRPGRQLSLSARYLYGFADGVHRWQSGGRWQANALDRRYLEWAAGHTLRDINPEHGIPRLFDAWMLLADQGSVRRYYDSRSLRLRAGSELAPGWEGWLEIEADRRRPVENSSQFTFRDSERRHPANDDLGNPALSERLDAHDQLRWGTALSWQPGVRFIRYPQQRFVLEAPYPRLTLVYRGGVRPDQASDAFHLLRLRAGKRDQVRTIYGAWSFDLEVGHFLTAPRHLQDYAHFSSNVTAIFSEVRPDQIPFLALPVYARASAGSFWQTRQEWDDQSFLFDKIPGLRKLGWTILLGGSHLWTSEQGHWSEASVGLGRLGYSWIRPLRLHGVLVYENGHYRGAFLRLGLQFPPGFGS